MFTCSHRFLRHRLLCLFPFLLLGSSLTAQENPPQGATLPITVPLPALLENREVLMVRVDLEPGQASPPHRHHAHVMVYVLSGEIEMRVNEEEVVRLGPGQTFLETPDDVHSIGRNVSTTEPASFLAILIKEAGAPVTVPAD